MSFLTPPSTKINNYVIETPWDSKIFGINTYEIRILKKEILDQILKTPGHYTVKANPHSSKKLLHDYGFYYCDTLIEPYCTLDRFIEHNRSEISILHNTDLEELIKISHGAFWGRFHRDFNIDKRFADLRYDSWLRKLYASENVFTLMHLNDT